MNLHQKTFDEFVFVETKRVRVALRMDVDSVESCSTMWQRVDIDNFNA